jgi:hypothetical protein
VSPEGKIYPSALPEAALLVCLPQLLTLAVEYVLFGKSTNLSGVQLGRD